jgi:hypothetical protein
VTGDGRADAIVVDDFEVFVSPAREKHFGSAELWAASPVWGFH